MGMYTGVRCKVIIKPEYREEIKIQHEKYDYEWKESSFAFIREYAKDSRADFIPRGSLSYMPDSWENRPKLEDGSYDWKNFTPTDGFDREFNYETGHWSFQCSLKNYEDTIGNFFENVLSKIAESVIHLEYYYEEWDKSIMYDLIDGKIQKSEVEGVDYTNKYF